MQDDCPERFDWEFVRWVLGYAKKGRHKALALLATASEYPVQVLHFRETSEVEELIRRVQANV